jgi:hypothetical protein
MTRSKCVLFAAALTFLGLSAGPVSGQSHTLTTGTGDASLTVSVDAFGTFFTDTYDPVGPITAAGATFRSQVAHRVGPTGPRAYLGGASTGPTGTPTSCTSSFTIGSLSFSLVQSVAPMFVGPTQTGSILTQAYTVTNTSAATVDFDLVRYYDGDLGFDGTLIDGGGRLPGPPETLFETDAGGSGSTSTTFVGLTALGGTIPTTDRFEILSFGPAGTLVLAGTPLGNSIQGDVNADGFIDPGNEYDVVLVLRNVFTLAPGASTVYTTTTIFGSGTPVSAVPGPSGVTVAESGGSTSVAEGGATDTYTVVLNSAPTANVTVTINAGTQLTAAPATLTFTPANWNVAQTVTVTAVDDALVEGAHTGTITHTSASTDTAYNGITIAGVTANIADNDTGTPPTPPTPPPTGGPEGTYAEAATGASGSATTSGSEGAFGFGNRASGTGSGVLQGPIGSGHQRVVLNAAHRRGTNTAAVSDGALLPDWSLGALAAGLSLAALAGAARILRA